MAKNEASDSEQPSIVVKRAGKTRKPAVASDVDELREKVRQLQNLPGVQDEHSY
jgi:polyhydroxyalkanoate synthesis regulator phasin